MFLVLCLPRSRSAWLAHYLAYPLARPRQLVGHEILTECDSVEKFLDSYKNGMQGTIETGGSMLWRIVRQEMPDCRIVLVRRPLIEVHQSLARAGLIGNLTELAESDAMLDAAETDPAIISIPFRMLSEPMTGRWIFEYCLELEFDFEWWSAMAHVNIQVDMPAWIERIQSNNNIRQKFREDVTKRAEGLGVCRLN